jgi:hypothetical protein
MNYYLTRGGETYGPYPEENFPAMVQAGQVVAGDLVCPEGGSDWVPFNQVPSLGHLKPAAPAKPAPAANPLKIQRASEASPPVAAPEAEAEAPRPFRPSPAPSVPTGVDWFTRFKGWAYGIGAAVVVIGFIVGFYQTQWEKRQIGKLETEPGWTAFNTGNTQIDSEESLAGYGNNTNATQLAKVLANALQKAEQANFTLESSGSGGRGIGRVITAVDKATAGKGRFQVFVELRNDRALVLIHVPEFKRFEGKARTAIREICWEAAGLVTSTALRRKPGFPLVVGLRDNHNSYDCVFVGALNEGIASGASLTKTVSQNVPSHVVLVRWFGKEKPS